MKILTLILIFISLVACNKEEAVWEELTDAEKDFLRQRAENECLAESANHFNEFKTMSGDKFYGSAAYAEGTTFNHTFKEGSVTDYTHKITIWKVTSTNVYFLIEIDDSTDEYRFLKIPKTTNDAMITDLQTKLCDKSSGRDQNFSISTGSLTYKKIIETSSKLNTHTFTYSRSLPAFFSLYKESRKEQPLDSEGDATGSATNMTGTLSAGATETNIPKYDTYTEYDDTDTLTTLCLVNYSVIPYTMTCDSTGATTFPSSEL